MSDTSEFRGYAGEAVRQFSKPASLFTAIPIAFIYAVVLGTLSLTGANNIFPLNIAIPLLVSGYLVGRFAIPASEGDINAGYFSISRHHIEARYYALRYLAITALWALPTAAMLYVLGKLTDGNAFITIINGSPSDLLAGGIGAIAGLFLLAIGIFAPTLSFLVATMTSSFDEIFSLDPWRYLLSRTADLLMFYVCLIGGVFAFFVLYFIPAVLLSSILGTFSSKLAMGVITAGALLPIVLAPVLLGKLCGAFVYYANTINQEESNPTSLLSHEDPQVAHAAATTIAKSHSPPSKQPNNTVGNDSQTSSTASGETRVNPQDYMNAKDAFKPLKIESLKPINNQSKESGQQQATKNISPKLMTPQVRPSDTALQPEDTLEQIHEPPTKNLLSAEELKNRTASLEKREIQDRLYSLGRKFEKTEDLPGLFEYQILLLKTDDVPKAIKVASKLILLSIDQKQTTFIEESFLLLGKERFNLNLIEADWKYLHMLLLGSRRFSDASVALAKSATSSKEQEQLPTKILGIMERAKKENSPSQALKIAQFLVKNFSDSPAAASAKTLLSEFT